MSDLFDATFSPALVADKEVKVTTTTALDKALPEVAKRVELMNSQLASLEQTINTVNAMLTKDRFGDLHFSRIESWRKAYLSKIFEDLNVYILDVVSVVESGAQRVLLEQAQETIKALQGGKKPAAKKTDVKSSQTAKALRDSLERMTPSERAMQAVKFEDAGDGDAAAICAETVSDQHLTSARRRLAAEKKKAAK
jgi:hypothetical protein